MGCINCRNNLRKTGSFDSIDSGASDNQFASLLQLSQDNIFPVEEPRVAKRIHFDQPKFTSSLAVYYNNIKQAQKINMYSQALADSPEIYFRHFPYLRWVDNEGTISLEREKSNAALRIKEGITNVLKTDSFQRHLRLTNMMINSILSITVNESIVSVGDSLRRLGAKHAELGIPATNIYAFRESFMTYLSSVLDHDKDVFRIWEAFIKFVVNMIIKGMNDHYQKILFVYWRLKPQKVCGCISLLPPRPTSIDPHAMLSLKNCAAAIEASFD